MAPSKKSASKPSTNKMKMAKPKASTAKASTTKANVKATTASRPQTRTMKHAEGNDGENIETDSAEHEDIDSDDVAGPKVPAAAGPHAKVAAPASQRIATRATNANQHPGEQHKILDTKRRTKKEMIEIRRQEAEQKEKKKEAARQKKIKQDEAIDRVAQFEMELANDTYNDTPLPRNRKTVERSKGGFDYVVADQDDGADDEEVAEAELIDDSDEDLYMSEELIPAKASKRKGRETNVEVDVVLETSESEVEDRPKKKARGKKSESEVEIVEDLEPKPNPKGKVKELIRVAISNKKIIGTGSDQNRDLGANKVRSSDVSGNLKPERYKFLTTQTMLTFDETTLFYYTISADVDQDGQKQSGIIKNWAETVAKAKAVSAATATSRSSTLRQSTASGSAGLKPKSRAIKREGAVLNILDFGGLSDRDETEGAEREAAVKSPPKNGKRVTSSVSN
jgi:hypothetical protein